MGRYTRQTVPLKYENLQRIYNESNSLNTPENFRKVDTAKNYPMYWFNPEDLNAVLNSFDVMDLFMKPNYSPGRTSYPT